MQPQQQGTKPAGGNAPPPRPYPWPVGVYEAGTIDYDNSQLQTATPSSSRCGMSPLPGGSPDCGSISP
jgi:hypothetical protein